MEPSIVLLTIPRNAALSAPVELTYDNVAGIILPDAWDAAPVSFAVSIDGAHFHDAYTPDGGEVTVSADIAKPGRFIALDFGAVRSLKVRSGTGASPVSQSQDRTVQLVVTNAG
jgi:hypothetical protein